MYEDYKIEISYRYSDKLLCKRNIFTTKDKIPYYINKQNEFSIHRSIYEYDDINNLSESKLIGNLVIDFDSDDNIEYARYDAITAISYLSVILKVPKDYIHIFFSGRKGFHLEVPYELFGIDSNNELPQIYKFLVTKINNFTKYKTLDLQIYHKRALLRVVNTINEKSNLYKIQITYDELRNLPINNIKILAKNKRHLIYKNKILLLQCKNEITKIFEQYILDKQKKKKQTSGKKYHFTPPCIQYILDNGADVGQRHEFISILSCFLRNKEMSLKDTIDYLIEWNSKNKIPEPKDKLTYVVKHNYYSKNNWGCNTFRDIWNICDESNCKLKNKKR